MEGFRAKKSNFDRGSVLFLSQAGLDGFRV